MSTPSVDLNDVHELSLDELDAVAGGVMIGPMPRLDWLVKVAGKAIGQDILAFAASQGVR
jgi:hypothetical protein